MKLRSFIITLTILLGVLGSKATPVLPVFSNSEEDHWYYIVFTAGETVLGDQGAGVSVITRIANRTKDNQLWKFIGNQEEFRILGKEGNYVYYDSRIRTTDDPAKAATFRLVPSANPALSDSWEIEYPDKGDEWNRWNQWGNTGPGVNIGLYTPGESNNAVKFLRQEDLPNVPELTTIKEYDVTPAVDYTPEHRHTLWYTNPATSDTSVDQWMEYALPIGNGEFGAMIFGGIAQDRIQFNDKSLWTGSPTTRGCYQNFGNLYIEDISGVFGNSADKAVTGYVRNLDMAEGKANVFYKSPDETVEYTREYIASYPDKAVVIRLGASQKEKISVRLRLFNGVKLGMLVPLYKNGEATIEGLLDLVSFKAKVRAVPTGGSVETKDDCIEIRNADELVIILAGATNFDQHSPTYISDVNAMYNMVDNRVDAAQAKGWDAMLSDHMADFGKYFGRAELLIDGAAHDRATDALVKRYNGRRPVPSPTDPSCLMLEELYYAFGRYLLISSSRGMDTPANLQGIWNHSNSPAWQCDIHSNINVQMNYWPAESTNLSEMHMPYLNYIYSMALEHEQWQEYARRSGQTTGWTCFTQNNIFGHSDYAENYVIANAWYCSHLWQHYLYTLDREFLKNRAMPVMTSCVRFWMERLVKDTDGKWVAPKEWSPEHGPAEEDATAHAQQILHELFKTTMLAIETLGDDAGVDNGFKTELRDNRDNLDKGLAIETYNG
ncbi:MAG: glycoside hydrolase family 95 protein, partial [Muribaculaceae bacterium]|nr:glycoside hydrolase family 95 protein [Muribaculaceae bacterium]